MNKRVSVREIFDTNPFSPYQVWVGFLCFCITFFEGFDLMITGVTLPSIAAFLHSKPTRPRPRGKRGFGGTFGRRHLPRPAGLLLGMEEDARYLCHRFRRFYRNDCLYRKSAGVRAVSVPRRCRFGRSYPVFPRLRLRILAPTRMRRLLPRPCTPVWLSGSVIAGIAAAYLLPAYGWQSLYFVGGILPAVIGVLLIFGLPETLDFLIGRGKGKKRILRRRLKDRPCPGTGGGDRVLLYRKEASRRAGEAPLHGRARLFHHNDLGAFHLDLLHHVVPDGMVPHPAQEERRDRATV